MVVACPSFASSHPNSVAATAALFGRAAAGVRLCPTPSSVLRFSPAVHVDEGEEHPGREGSTEQEPGGCSGAPEQAVGRAEALRRILGPLPPRARGNP
jgi:hypothetical protein